MKSVAFHLKSVLFCMAVSWFLLLNAKPTLCATVWREMVPSVEPGEALSVTLHVETEGDAVDFYTLDEIYPTGWTVIDDGGLRTDTPGHLKIVVLSGVEDTDYTYILEAPLEPGLYSFQGIFQFQGDASERTIEGDTEVTIGCESTVDCNDQNPCTDDACIDFTCSNTNNSSPCNDNDPCTMDDVCFNGICSGDSLDEDGDEYVSDDCGGNDCDDNNSNVNPGSPEGPVGDPTCSDGLDNDCDSFADGLDTACQVCTVQTMQEDCDDDNPCTDDDCLNSTCVHTNNTDSCDDGDFCTMNDRCSGGSCSGDPLDEDQDTYTSDACGGSDCDDSDPDIHPGIDEIGLGLCDDGVDQNCDGSDCTFDVCTDNDGDGYGNPASPSCTHSGFDCDDTDPNVNPGVKEAENAGNCDDEMDNDCDGLVDTDPGDCPDNGGDFNAAGDGDDGGCGCALLGHPADRNPLQPLLSGLIYLLPAGYILFRCRKLRTDGRNPVS